MQQSIDDNLFKWQDAITDVIEDLTNLTLAASKGQRRRGNAQEGIKSSEGCLGVIFNEQ